MPISSQDVNVVNTPLDTNVLNFPATQPVSGSVSVSNLPSIQDVAVTNTVNVITAQASSSTVAQVVMTLNTNTTLLAANANRKSAIIFIPQQPVQVKFGVGASATSFTYNVNATNTTITVTGYTGQIDAFGKNGTVNVTELI